jgi:methyl-accepting chemotaxis protein
VESMNVGRELVSAGTSLAEQTSAAFGNIIQSTTKVSDVISQVATASEEQSATSNEMARTMTQMADSIAHSSQSVGSIAASIDAVLRQTEDLQRLISQFVIR